MTVNFSSWKFGQRCPWWVRMTLTVRALPGTIAWFPCGVINPWTPFFEVFVGYFFFNQSYFWFSVPHFSNNIDQKLDLALLNHFSWAGSYFYKDIVLTFDKNDRTVSQTRHWPEKSYVIWYPYQGSLDRPSQENRRYGPWSPFLGWNVPR